MSRSDGVEQSEGKEEKQPPQPRATPWLEDSSLAQEVLGAKPLQVELPQAFWGRRWVAPPGISEQAAQKLARAAPREQGQPGSAAHKPAGAAPREQGQGDLSWGWLAFNPTLPARQGSQEGISGRRETPEGRHSWAKSGEGTSL